MRYLGFLLLALGVLSGCSSYEKGAVGRPAAQHGAPVFSGTLPLQPRIIAASAPLQCVPFARAASGIALRGDAWTWWPQAEKLYHRSNRPSVGSVFVLQRTSHLRYGHVAVVTAVLNDREIVVRHANWLNRGEVHEDTPVIDVSKGNDWSLVRFWYTPGRSYGRRYYPANGFIYPERLQAAL